MNIIRENILREPLSARQACDLVEGLNSIADQISATAKSGRRPSLQICEQDGKIIVRACESGSVKMAVELNFEVEA